MRIKMFAATAAIALSFGATSASADCGEVSITEMVAKYKLYHHQQYLHLHH